MRGEWPYGKLRELARVVLQFYIYRYGYRYRFIFVWRRGGSWFIPVLLRPQINLFCRFKENFNCDTHWLKSISILMSYFRGQTDEIIWISFGSSLGNAISWALHIRKVSPMKSNIKLYWLTIFFWPPPRWGRSYKNVNFLLLFRDLLDEMYVAWPEKAGKTADLQGLLGRQMSRPYICRNIQIPLYIYTT